MASIDSINIIKRDGSYQHVDFNKILKRLQYLKNMEPKLNINVSIIAQKTISMIINNITTQELDIISASICSNMIV